MNRKREKAEGFVCWGFFVWLVFVLWDTLAVVEINAT